MYATNLAAASHTNGGYNLEHGSAYGDSVVVKGTDLEEQVGLLCPFQIRKAFCGTCPAACVAFVRHFLL